MFRRTRARALCAALALGATAVVAAACGSSSDSSSGGGGEKSGGSITISQTSQPDYLDPALSYTVNGWEPMWLVYTGLLTYKHAEGQEGATVIPGLAETVPSKDNGGISADGKTYKLKLRSGLKYSDGTPVKASDFEHSIKRVLNLESGGASFYEGIVGAQEYEKAGKANGDISGITTNDSTGDITIKLTDPNGQFNNILAMLFAGLVPSSTPFKNMTKTPPPGVGTYKITSSVPNRQFVMQKVPTFKLPGVPAAKIDTITTKIVKSPQQQAQDVLNNTLDYMQDPPPSDLLPEVKSKAANRFAEHTTVSTYYFFMNVRTPPFDKQQVREAVNYAIDKRALARIFSGLFTPGCTFLPPGMPGYKETTCKYGDPNAAPNLAKAKQLIQQAGAKGAAVTVWGNSDDTTPKITQYYADVLNQIGLKATPKILDGGVYFQTIGNQKTKAQTGFADWFQDFPNPGNFFFLVNGASIQDTNNQNFSNVDHPTINKGIDTLNLEPDPSAVADKWAALDKQLVDDAYIAPYGYRKLTTFLSDRLNFQDCNIYHPLYLNDYSAWCLK